MRIMAGMDKEFTGEAWAPTVSAWAILAGTAARSVQERARQRHGRRRQKKTLIDRYNEIAANYTDETADEMSKLQDEIEAQGLWDLDSQVDQAMDALRCPDRRRRGREPFRRREAPCRADEAAARRAGHSSARRTDQPSRRRVRSVAGAHAAEYKGW